MKKVLKFGLIVLYIVIALCCYTQAYAAPATTEVDIDAYHDDYAYQYFGTMENGVACQVFYNRMDKVAKEFHTNTTLNADNSNIVATIPYADLGLSSDEAIAVWKMYKADHPLYYWISTKSSLTELDFLLLTDSEYANGNDRVSYNELVYASITEYMKLIEGETSPYRIALAFHDEIINTIDYAYEEDGVTPKDDPWAHNILGVFEKKSGVCEAYARTFQLLLNCAGIENVFVTGLASDVSGGNVEDHAWNLVKMDDGAWYWFDLTWDDTPDWMWGISYNYFCVNDMQDVGWSDGSDFSSGETFVLRHSAELPSATGIAFQYELPERAQHTFSESDTLLRSTFTVDEMTYAIVGYNSVQLTEVRKAGDIVIPETVQYGENTYTVISVGSMNEDRLFQDGGTLIGSPEVVSITIPKTVAFLWRNAFLPSSSYGSSDIFLKEIIVDPNNPKFTSLDGVLYTKSLYTLIQYPSCKEAIKFTMPDETVRYEENAFQYLKYLEELVIGSSFERVCNRYRGYAQFDSDMEGIPHMSEFGLSAVVFVATKENFQISVSEKNQRFYIQDDLLLADGGTLFFGVCHKKKLTVKIPEGVTTIMSESLSSRLLVELHIPKSVVKCNMVFGMGMLTATPMLTEVYNCSNLNISFPTSVKNIYTPNSGSSKLSYIGDFIFYCDGTENLLIGCSKGQETLVFPENYNGNPYSIKGTAFADTHLVKNIVIRGDIINIGNLFIGNGLYTGAFPSFPNLKSATIGAKNIGLNAFTNFANLENLILEDGVERIDKEAFSHCDSLTNVVIPNSVTTIGEYAFGECHNLTSITVPELDMELWRIFQSCNNITSVTFSEGVTTIPVATLMGFSGLTTVILPNSLTTIERQAFDGCTSLTNIVIPNGVTSIGQIAFRNCTSLTSIVIPEGVISIETWAFMNCTGLTDITIPESVTNWGSSPFIDCKFSTVTISSNIESFSKVFSYSTVETVIFSDTVTEIHDSLFRDGDSPKNIILPASIKKIGNSAFSHYSGPIVLPDGVITIGDYAFSGCKGLTSIVIPDTVISIGDYAFSGCNGLTSIVIPDTVISVGKGAFRNCTGLTTVTIPACVTNFENVFGSNSSVTTVILSDSVTRIAEGMFKHCTRIQNVILPPTVESIGEAAFYRCTSLSSITIPRSTTVIEDYYDTFALCTNLKEVYICSPDIAKDLNELYIQPLIAYANIIYIDSLIAEVMPDMTVKFPYKAIITHDDVKYVAYSKESLAVQCEHKYSSEKVEPVCTEQGYTVYTCYCGDIYADSYVNALGHSYGNCTQTVAPTCTTEGENRHDCERCDHFETEVVAALGHTLADAVIENRAEPTCTEVGGYDEVVYCTVCGAELSREHKVLEALGHSHDAVVTAPTCTEQGYTTHTCHCGDTYTDSETEALGHKPGAEADCLNDQVCTVCGEVLVEKLGHDYVAVVTDPTCTEAGYTTHTCSRCDDSYTDSETEVLGHTEGDEADCLNDQVCMFCGEVLVGKFGHNYKAVVIEPTCTTDGYTTHTCSRCDDSYTDSFTEALGHTAGDEADCLNDQVCTVCGEVLTEKLGHDYKAVVTDPTCTTEGYTTHTCSRCDDTYTDSETEALGHTVGEWVVDQEPAPGIEGCKHTECTICGETLETAAIEALPVETESETVVETEPETETKPDTGIQTELEPPYESDSKQEEPVTSNGCSSIVSTNIFCMILMLSIVGLFFAKRKKEHF